MVDSAVLPSFNVVSIHVVCRDDPKVLAHDVIGGIGLQPTDGGQLHIYEDDLIAILL